MQSETKKYLRSCLSQVKGKTKQNHSSPVALVRTGWVLCGNTGIYLLRIIWVQTLQHHKSHGSVWTFLGRISKFPSFDTNHTEETYTDANPH